MQLDLSRVTEQIAADSGNIFTHRDEKTGIVRGQLFKTAQNLSTFQRHQFFRRYYELSLITRQLKIFEKEGGLLKDTINCEVEHVVTGLKWEVRPDY